MSQLLLELVLRRGMLVGRENIGDQVPDERALGQRFQLDRIITDSSRAQIGDVAVHQGTTLLTGIGVDATVTNGQTGVEVLPNPDESIQYGHRILFRNLKNIKVGRVLRSSPANVDLSHSGFQL
jgi:hypothetical protein